jgi:ABC-2 type transport system permease protein
VTGRAAIVRAILAKDVRAFARDPFYVVVSILGLVVYVGVFWLLPATVQETVTIGVRLEGLGPALGALDGEGLEVRSFRDPAELEAAVLQDDEVVAGLDFPDGFVRAVAAGEATRVRLLLTADAPQELRPALGALVREASFLIAGEQPPVTLPDLEEVVLGPDRTGEQASLRELMRPLFVFFVLLVEMFALASLVAAEIHQRTISAILVTPARVSDVLAAKAILGTALAFGQGLLLLLATGTAGADLPILAVALLFGAVLVTGVALIAGSIGRDFITIVFLGVLFMVPLAIPAFAVLLPGSVAGWVQALPTYGLVRVLVDVTAYSSGWGEVAGHLTGLALWCVAGFLVGVLVLTRRVARI